MLEVQVRPVRGVALDSKNRLVLVRRHAVPLTGPEPLVRDGFWSGRVVHVDEAVVKIKLDCGTARQDIVITLPVDSKDWRIRFP